MQSDADLVRRARGGDRDAFAALVERHHATLVRCCRRMVGDAAHDAALTAMLSLDRLRDDNRFGAWLVGIGLNACRALLRGQSLHIEGQTLNIEGQTLNIEGQALHIEGQALHIEGQALHVEGQTPHEVAEARELAGRVRAAIAELPDGQREAATLFYLAARCSAASAG